MKQNTGLKIYAAVITAAVLGLLFLCFQPGREGKETGADNDNMFIVGETRFDTPEAAIGHLVKGLQENDMQTILEAWAIGDLEYDFVKTVGGIGMYSHNMYWPEQYQMYHEINQISAAQSMVLDLKCLVWSVNIPDVESMIPLGRTTPDGLLTDPGRFESLLDASRLAGLKAEQIRLIPTDRMYVEQMEKQYGVKDLQEAAVLYSLDGQYYGGGVMLFETENGWKIRGLYSSLDGLNGNGELVVITPEEFGQLAE